MSAARPIPVLFSLAILANAVALASAACTTTGSVGTGVSPTASATGTVAGLQQAYVDVIRRVLPSVVEIRTAAGLGSGVIFDSTGDIVTNAHVVGSARSFQVFLAGSARPLAGHAARQLSAG
jgi:S1-C subfamily serine protease